MKVHYVPIAVKDSQDLLMEVVGTGTKSILGREKACFVGAN